MEQVIHIVDSQGHSHSFSANECSFGKDSDWIVVHKKVEAGTRPPIIGWFFRPISVKVK